MQKPWIALLVLLLMPDVYAGEATGSRPVPARLTRHRAAPALSAGAMVSDWSQFLGPNGDRTSFEKPLKLNFGAEGPALVWEIATGSGYAAPAISGERLVFFHRVEDEARVECVLAETGESLWTFGYPSDYKDRYDFNNGPRASPVISDGRVYTHGAGGKLHCLNLADGALLWNLDTSKVYNVPQDFFGLGPTPVVHGELLILGIGAPAGPCVVALNKQTGKEVWRAGKTWRAGYASPVVAKFHGKPRVLFFAGGDDDPPTGGLLGVDPADGRVVFQFPFRSRAYSSVNASNPVVSGNRIFISSSYKTGGALLEVQPDDSIREVWRTRKFGSHFMTPIVRDGYLYGVTGAGTGDTNLACVSWETGDTLWQKAPRWPTKVVQGGKPREITLTISRGNLLGLHDGFLILGEQGNLAWAQLTAAGYEERSQASLFFANETWTPPVLSHGLLYICQNQPDRVGGSSPRLLCYSLR